MTSRPAFDVAQGSRPVSCHRRTIRRRVSSTTILHGCDRIRRESHIPGGAEDLKLWTVRGPPPLFGRLNPSVLAERRQGRFRRGSR